MMIPGLETMWSKTTILTPSIKVTLLTASLTTDKMACSLVGKDTYNSSTNMLHLSTMKSILEKTESKKEGIFFNGKGSHKFP